MRCGGDGGDGGFDVDAGGRVARCRRCPGAGCWAPLKAHGRKRQRQRQRRAQTRPLLRSHRSLLACSHVSVQHRAPLYTHCTVALSHNTRSQTHIAKRTFRKRTTAPFSNYIQQSLPVHFFDSHLFIYLFHAPKTHASNSRSHARTRTNARVRVEEGEYTSTDSRHRQHVTTI